ncbi:MAG: hypothetical protein ACYTDV_17600 [Planctomycetota bacterium]
MTLEQHRKCAGRVYIVLTSLFLLFSLIAVLRDLNRISRAGWRVADLAPLIFSTFFLVLGVLLVCNVFLLCFGVALVKGHRWATRVIGFLVAGLSLFAFPLYTAIGGYTLWVLI